MVRLAICRISVNRLSAERERESDYVSLIIGISGSRIPPLMVDKVNDVPLTPITSPPNPLCGFP